MDKTSFVPPYFQDREWRISQNLNLKLYPKETKKEIQKRKKSLNQIAFEWNAKGDDPPAIPPLKYTEEKFLVLTCPIVRYEEKTQDLILHFQKVENSTFDRWVLRWKDILSEIYQFYQKPLTKEDFKTIGTKNFDLWGYIKNSQKAFQKGEVVKKIELMGDCVFFEGIQIDENAKNKWYLCLGS